MTTDISSDRQNPTMAPRWDIWSPRIFLLAVSLLALVLVFRIVTADTGIDMTITTNESDQITASDTSPAVVEIGAFVQANERLLQMIQWTLGLVITVGGLLVGFSWFQSRSRMEDDRRTLDDHQRKLSASSLHELKRIEEQFESVKWRIDEHNKALSYLAGTVRDIEDVLKPINIQYEVELKRAETQQLVRSVARMIAQGAKDENIDYIIGVADEILAEFFGPFEQNSVDDLLDLAYINVTTLLANGKRSNFSKEVLLEYKDRFNKSSIHEKRGSIMTGGVAEWEDVMNRLIDQAQ